MEAAAFQNLSGSIQKIFHLKQQKQKLERKNNVATRTIRRNAWLFQNVN